MPSLKDIKYNTPIQPRQIRLDTIARCNAVCASCHRVKTSRAGEMSFDLIEEILEDISHFPTPLEEIVPVDYGEFFLRKDWYEILVRINHKAPATRIVIPTNGALITGDMLDKLCGIPSVKVLNFSVNAYYDETYQAFTGLLPPNIEKIRMIVAKLKMYRPDIVRNVSMVFDPQYQTDLERDEFIKYWMPFANPWILPAASAGRDDKKPIIKTEIPCRSIFSDFVIGYDKKLSSCCFDANFTLNLGYYSGHILTDWHNKELKELRGIHNDHDRQSHYFCSNCTFA